MYASWPALPSAHATLAPGRLARAYPVRSFTGWTAPALAGAFFESYQAASASLYDQVWMTGWRLKVNSKRPGGRASSQAVVSLDMRANVSFVCAFAAHVTLRIADSGTYLRTELS